MPSQCRARDRAAAGAHRQLHRTSATGPDGPLCSLVVGGSGTGKSTAVRNAMRSLTVPKGAIYFSAPELVSFFSRDLARAVGYAPPFDPPRASSAGWAGKRPLRARTASLCLSCSARCRRPASTPITRGPPCPLLTRSTSWRRRTRTSSCSCRTSPRCARTWARCASSSCRARASLCR